MSRICVILAAFLIAQFLIWWMLDLPTPLRFRLFLSSAIVAGGVLVIRSWMKKDDNAPMRLIGIGLGLLLPAACFGMVRVDGFLGDGSRDFRWRVSERQSVAADEVVVSGALKNSESLELRHAGFLGNNRDGVLHGVRLNADWKTHPPRELWRRTVGAAWSSVAVADGRVVTQEQRAEGEATVCYDLRNGDELWLHVEPGVRFSEPYGGDGPRATPTIHGSSVYSLGATGVLNCLDLETGTRAWSRNILEDATAANKMWAMSGSPLVFDDLVVVNAGGIEGYSLIAYSKTDGNIVWHTGDSPASYSSPVLATLHGVQQVVMQNGSGLEGYDATSGERLWLCPFLVNGGAMCSISQPVVLPAGKDRTSPRIFVSGGYGKGCALIEVVADAGKMTAKAIYDDNLSLKSKMSNIVRRDDVVWGLDEGIMVCVQIRTGKRLWKRGRYGHGQLVLLEEQILVQKESGDLVLVAADQDGHHELASMPALSGKTWNHPVLVGNLLLVRNNREAACLEVQLQEQTDGEGE